jgi:hypothetical protein
LDGGERPAACQSILKAITKTIRLPKANAAFGGSPGLAPNLKNLAARLHLGKPVDLSKL